MRFVQQTLYRTVFYIQPPNVSSIGCSIVQCLFAVFHSPELVQLFESGSVTWDSGLWPEYIQMKNFLYVLYIDHT